MNVFFSGEDMREITGNAVNHNYYLSLIVNNRGEFCAKIASKGELKEQKIRNYTYTSEDGKAKAGKSTTNSKRDVIFTYNCDVTVPEVAVVKPFQDLVAGIIKKAEEKVKSVRTLGNGGWTDDNGKFHAFSQKTL